MVHGGKQNRSDVTMKLLKLCADLSRQGFNVLTFDRRGCGASDVPHRILLGHFERDVAGAIDFIRSHYHEKKIYLLGVSIGAVAALIGAEMDKSVCGVIIDSCFANTREMTKRALRKANLFLTVFTPGAALMGRLIYRFQPPNAIDHISGVDCPIFFIHGENDRGVPVTDSAVLHRASGNSMDELWIAPAADHNKAYARYPEEYIKRVVDFMVRKCGSGD
ncbi:alpha/beta hydrolase [Chloroflexota bacterium]